MTDPLRPDGLPQPRNAFESAVVDLIVDLFEAYPTWGTSAGYHRVDGRWPDLSEAGRQARLATFSRHRARLAGFAEEELSPDEPVDRSILLEEIEKVVFGDEVLRSEAWDALELVYLMGGGLFGLLSREYAPWSERGAALLSRIEGLPALTRAALAGLTGLPDRPVALLQLDTALAQLAGVTELVDAAVAEARRRAEAGEAPELVAPMEAAAAAPTPPSSASAQALDTDVRARARGRGPAGTGAVRPEAAPHAGQRPRARELRERAWADYHAVRAEMLRLAREVWPTWIPDEPLPGVAEGDTAGRVGPGPARARRHRRAAPAARRADQLLRGGDRTASAPSAASTSIITLPDEPLTITWTPVFLRATARAFLDSPGPLDRGQKSHFWITPPDESRGPRGGGVLPARGERRRAAHPQHPRGHPRPLPAAGRLQPLPVAGAHHLHQRHVRRGLGRLRHAGDVRRGLCRRRSRLRAAHWKMYLRATANAILDVETHTGGMTEERGHDA